ncbi:MAG: hypothetical protein A4E53_04317 [Pelotomaculum sp. PtaB.Bin104]|nr:MAG: hypothetical protein A4E53_04317 [Pelotomaculum sp. PtaB.Bin104]
MEQCPLAYIDPCSKCAQYGNCSPSQSVLKLNILEKDVQDLKKMLKQLIDKE